MNSYDLSRSFFNWSFENPEKIRPIHSAIYFFAIEHCNRLGWKSKFGLPSQMVMEAIGVKNWRTYSLALKELVEFGFIEMIETSKNQYSSNIIAIVKNTKAPTKALDKALQKHSTKQSQSTVSIDKQETNKQGTINNKDLMSGKPDHENNFDVYVNYINKIFNRNFKTDSWKSKSLTKFKNIIKKYDRIELFGEDLKIVCEKIKTDSYHLETKFKHITPEFILRPDKFEKFLNVPIEQNQQLFDCQFSNVHRGRWTERATQKRIDELLGNNLVTTILIYKREIA